MIISRTPYRISLFGGGSDYREWFKDHGGTVLSTTIDRYCYILLRRMPPFLGTRYRVFWSQMEKVDTVDAIQHDGVRECLKFLGIDEPIEINHAGDLPARSGLASSSAFTVGMLNALYALNGQQVSRGRLANEAICIERTISRNNCGVQDQIECAFGGINVVNIDKDGSYNIRQLDIKDRASLFEEYLVLVFTDITRDPEATNAQTKNDEPTQKLLLRMMEMVPIAAKILESGTPVELGHLLHETWILKRQLSNKITNSRIDSVYETARQNGAIGGKLLGAGGGGFMLFCVPPEKRRDMLDALKLQSVPVRFEYSGSQLILT